LWEEHRLRLFENRVLRRPSGPKIEEDGSWRKLHNDEIHNLYSSPNIVKGEGKSKLIPVLLTEHHAMKASCGV
jgi:hypothetical protein